MPNPNNLSPGGTKISTRAIGIGNWQPVLSTPGTTGGGANTATAIAARYTSLWVPGDCLVQGIRFLQGLTAAVTKATAVLYDEGGTALAYSALAGTVMSGASTYLALPFTVPYLLNGPGVFFAAILFDGVGSTYGTVPVNTHQGILGGSSVQLFPATAAAINVLTVSATPFTDAQAPVVHLY